jgi:hypothetical protein
MTPGAKFSTMTSGPLGHVLDELDSAFGFQIDDDGFLVGVEQQEILGVFARAGRPAQ